MIRTLHLILILIIASIAGVAHADETGSSVTRVELRSTVRLAFDHEHLTLGDLARIEGPQAESLEHTAIKQDTTISSGGWSTIGIDSVRKQLKDAQAINFGAIVVQGSDIQITRLADPHQVRTKPSAQTPEPVHNGRTLRDDIERWVYARLKSSPDATRLHFNERDQAMLNTPTGSRIVEIRELGRSDRMSLGIVIYEHEQIVLENTIRFEALVERSVLVTTMPVRRREAITQETTRVERRWLPTTEPIAEPSTSIGQVTRNTIDPGTVVLASMLEAPIIVERGQFVSARSIAGSVSVSMKVRAREDGRLGEVIELESRDGTQRFHARIAGIGRVVMVHESEAQQNTESRSSTPYAGRP